MEKLVADLKASASTVFEGEDYRLKREAIDRSFAERGEALLKTVADEANENGLVLLRTQQGLVIVPQQEDGQNMPADAFQALPAEEKERLQVPISAAQAKLQEYGSTRSAHLEGMARRHPRAEPSHGQGAGR